MKMKTMWVLLALGLLAVSVSAIAQPPVTPAPAGGLGGDGANAGGPHAALMQRMGQGMASAPAIAVAGNFVYVVLGRTLYQFSVDGLKLVAQAQLGPEGRETLVRKHGAGGKGKGGKGAILPAPDAGVPNANPAAPAGDQNKDKADQGAAATPAPAK